MKHPITDAALDDRLGFIGTSGSGKTYNSGTAVERLLDRKARAVIIDPLGVWWGLRLLADGKTPSKFDVVIFGGPHGDLPLTDLVGALIGETAATMAESCIIDLSQLGSKSAERRFMLGFLDAIYRKANGEPFHLVVDEADLFAPQKPQKGDEALLGMMENIVRRGRVKGFIPWLISQRPAVLNKNVLSQVDGLLAFMLTASHDKDALDGWIEGQADRAHGRAIKDALPTMPVGTGVVWIPRRGILDTVKFPPKVTFDSSRTPKRGEKVTRTAALKPLDLGSLKDKLATVQAEKEASDPKVLNAQIAELKRQLAKADKGVILAAKTQSDGVSDAERQRIVADAEKQIAAAQAAGFNDGRIDLAKELLVNVSEMKALGIQDLAKAIDRLATALEKIGAGQSKGALKFTPPKSLKADVAQPVERRPSKSEATGSNPVVRSKPSTAPVDVSKMAKAERVFLTVLVQRGRPLTRTKLAIFSGYSVKSGHIDNTLGTLRAKGWASGGNDAIQATDAGREAVGPVEPMPEGDELRRYWLGEMDKAGAAFLRILFDIYPQSITRDDLAERGGYSPTSGHVDNTLGKLRSFELAEGKNDAIRAASDLME